MKNNNEYYSELIVMDEQPAEVLMGLVKSNYMPFLDHWNQKGSDQVGIVLDALSNLFGLDFELYSADTGFSPYYIKTSFNKVTIDEPVRLWFDESGNFVVFISESTNIKNN